MLGSEEEKEDDDADAIMVCYRVSMAEKVMEGSGKDKCFTCGEEVWISPASQKIRDQYKASVACVQCALEHALPAEGKDKEDLMDSFKKVLETEAKNLGLGATGRFPFGKIDEADQGELKTSLSIKGDKLVMNFGKSVTFVAMTKEQALMIADGLKKWAAKLP
jgi:hypothetical protein